MYNIECNVYLSEGGIEFQFQNWILFYINIHRTNTFDVDVASMLRWKTQLNMLRQTNNVWTLLIRHISCFSIHHLSYAICAIFISFLILPHISMLKIFICLYFLSQFFLYRVRVNSLIILFLFYFSVHV